VIRRRFAWLLEGVAYPS
jgi:hypothetical protein